MDLVGTTRIAKMFGVTRQRANQIVNESKDFPKRLDGPPPLEAKPLESGPVWKRAAVVKWAAKHDRTIQQEEA